MRFRLRNIMCFPGSTDDGFVPQSWNLNSLIFLPNSQVADYSL